MLKWLYNWATVITGIVTGVLALLPSMIDATFSALNIIGPVDLTQWGIDPLTAARITTAVAIFKGLHAFYRYRQTL